MRAVVATAALGVTAAGVLVVVVGTVLTGDARRSLRAGLDLWLAAGLLRLTDAPPLAALAAAGAIIGIRQLIGASPRRRPT